MSRTVPVAVGIGAAGVLACALGWVLQPEVLLPSLLWSGLFWLGLSLGCMTLRLVHSLTGGDWGRFAGPVYAGGATALPVAVVAFVLLLTGLEALFPWTAPTETLPASVRAKLAWLEPGFFTLRTLVILAAWTVMAWLAARPGPVSRATAAGLLVVHVLLVSVFAFDWIMSLDPQWFSTILGLLVGAAQVLAAGALTVLAVNTLQGWREAERAKARVDLANLLMALALVWLYLAFSEYLIIWSANLPEEVTWYLARSEHGWPALSIATALLQFAVPFALLVSRSVKSRPGALAGVAGSVLAGHLLYIAWLTLPGFRAGAWDLRWTDPAALAAVGGPWVALFVLRLRHPADGPSDAPPPATGTADG